MTDPRPENVRAYFDRHAYTQGNWVHGEPTIHVCDVAEKGQHQQSVECPCGPIVWEQELGTTVLHEFDPTAIAPVPPK